MQQFRNDAHTREIIGERDTPMGRSLYLARPITAEPKCLVCHSLPATAPATLLARYGNNNGFGWQPNEIIGAQVVSVPLAAATANADHIFRSIMRAIIAILSAALVIVNVVLYFAVVRPVRRMAHIADEVSLGNSAIGEFPARGSTELVRAGALIQSHAHQPRQSAEDTGKLDVPGRVRQLLRARPRLRLRVGRASGRRAA